MSINIQRDKKEKSMNVDSSNSEDYLNATLSRNSESRFENETRIEESESDDELGLEYLANETKENENEGNTNSISDSNSNYQQQFHVEEPSDEVNFEEEQALRIRYLSQLRRLHKRGMRSQKIFNLEDSSYSIKNEVNRLKKEKETENGVNYCKQGLVFFASTIEMANRTMGEPAKLSGWGAHIMKSQDDYDEVFEELYYKYAGTIEMGPEIKLITMIAGSAFMFHLNKIMAENAMNGGAIPDFINKMMNKAPNASASAPVKREMKGPSMDSEELLKKLSADDYDDLSSNMSSDSDDSSNEAPASASASAPAPASASAATKKVVVPRKRKAKK